MPLSVTVRVLAVLSAAMRDFERRRREKLRLRDRLIAQFVAGIGRIGDELAQEHLALGIDRMHHEIEKLATSAWKAWACGPSSSGISARFRRRLRHAPTTFATLGCWCEGILWDGASRQAAAGIRKSGGQVTLTADSTQLTHSRNGIGDPAALRTSEGGWGA